MSEEMVEGVFEEEEGTWGLVLPFDTDDPEFTRGFTCGMIWQLMELDTPGIELTVSSNNVWMCAQMADAGGYLLEAKETGVVASELEDADWMNVSFTRNDLVQEAA